MLICSPRLLFLDMVDKAFTQKISQWFDSEHTDENIREGAMMLLQINNNKHLYQVISFNPQGKLELLKYELRKHLNYRNAGMTLDEVRNYDNAVTPIIQAAVDRTAEADEQAPDFIPHLPQLCGDNVVLCPEAIIAKGKREDHNQLPAHIQDIWEANAALWKKIKEHFEACKAYTQSCDRYEGLHAADEGFTQLLHTLKQEYYAYKQGMEVYDHATVTNPEDEPAEQQSDAAITAKQISNARSYITKSLPKIIELEESGEADKAAALRDKVSERVQLLVSAKAELTADTIAKIQQAGIEMQPAEEQVEESAAENQKEQVDESESDSTSSEAASAE